MIRTERKDRRSLQFPNFKLTVFEVYKQRPEMRVDVIVFVFWPWVPPYPHVCTNAVAGRINAGNWLKNDRSVGLFPLNSTNYETRIRFYGRHRAVSVNYTSYCTIWWLNCRFARRTFLSGEITTGSSVFFFFLDTKTEGKIRVKMNELPSHIWIYFYFFPAKPQCVHPM